MTIDRIKATLRTSARIVTGLTLALAFTACAGRGPRMADEALAPLAELRYPTDAPRGDDLDIVVVRSGSRIQLANRTPRSYRGMQLWLNEQWVGVADHIAIGVDNAFDLNNFVDQHGRTYPVAGLLAPDRSQPLVHAELFDPSTNERHRITVQLSRRQPVRGTSVVQYE